MNLALLISILISLSFNNIQAAPIPTPGGWSSAAKGVALAATVGLGVYAGVKYIQGKKELEDQRVKQENFNKMTLEIADANNKIAQETKDAQNQVINNILSRANTHERMTTQLITQTRQNKQDINDMGNMVIDHEKQLGVSQMSQGQTQPQMSQGQIQPQMSQQLMQPIQVQQQASQNYVQKLQYPQKEVNQPVQIQYNQSPVSYNHNQFYNPTGFQQQSSLIGVPSYTIR
jgi:hypothetical protein